MTTKKRLDADARAHLARQWLESGLTQEQFAAQVGISARTLRAYVRRLPGRRWDRQLEVAVRQALDVLGDVLGAMQAGESEISRSSAASTPEAATMGAAPAGSGRFRWEES